MADIKQYSKEMYDLMEFFERTINKTVYVGGDFKREDKAMWQRCQYYCNGSVNDMFKIFICGYTYRKAIEGTCFDKTEHKQKEKTITYHIDNGEGIISLHKYDRTYANQLAEGKGETLGMLVTMLANEIERLPRSESLSITVNK